MGMGEGRKITWVAWEKVCELKEEGVRDYRYWGF